MKTFITISICMFAAFMVTPAMGQAIPSVSFDENGTGLWNGNQLDHGIGDAGVDPVVQLPTLFYYLPFPVVEGDLQVIEPDGTLSDVLRFITYPTINASRVYVYSDIEATDIVKDLADVGLPNPWHNVVLTQETGLEGGLNGVIWEPTPNDPGASPAGAAPVTYGFISDVPEPATMCLLAIGSFALLGRKQKA
jgi:hypothetical protein